MKVLIIEDNEVLCEILKEVLPKHQYVVEMTSSGKEVLYLAEQYPHDAIVLDVLLPDMNGFTILKTLREKNIRTPVLILTLRGALVDRVQGLNLGADDYLVKPFDMPEFLARLASVIRRGKGGASNIVQVRDLKIDTAPRIVKRGGTQIALTNMEYNILEYLMFNIGKVISRTELKEHLYPMGFKSDSNSLDVHITHLRNKIDKPYPEKLIGTKRGVGFTIASFPGGEIEIPRTSQCHLS